MNIGLEEEIVEANECGLGRRQCCSALPPCSCGSDRVAVVVVGVVTACMTGGVGDDIDAVDGDGIGVDVSVDCVEDDW